MAIIEKGKEPEKTKKRMETFFAKLDEAYPDKKISRLHQDHKKWGETLTALYRELGYPDSNSFLEAYGYSVERGGGKAKNDAAAVIAELKRRYPNGPTCTKLYELMADNPDLASKFKNLSNQSNQLFGMTFAKYLVLEGLLLGDAPIDREQEFFKLKEKYKDHPYAGQLKDFKAENQGIKWSAVEWAFSHQRDAKTMKAFLIKEGIIANEDDPIELEKTSGLQVLKERYHDSPFNGTIKELKEKNSDISWREVEKAFQKQKSADTFKAFLVQEGVLSIETTKTKKEILKELTEDLIQKQLKTGTIPNSIDAFLAKNPEIQLEEFERMTLSAHSLSAKEYLTWKGLLRDNEAAEKVESIMAVLRPRYLEKDSKEKARSISHLQEMNPDVDLSGITQLTKAAFGKTGTEYLTQEGLLINWTTYAEESRKKQEEELAAKRKADLEKRKRDFEDLLQATITAKPDSLDQYVVENGVVVSYTGNQQIVSFPDGVIEIGKEVLRYSGNKQAVRIPPSVRRIHTKAFEKTYIKIVVIEGCETIEQHAFSNCSYLTKVVLPEGLREIQQEAFKNSRIKEINWPSSLSVIGKDAFFETGLPKDTIPNWMTQKEGESLSNYIGLCDENGCLVRDGALLLFSGDPHYIVVSDGVEIVSEKAFKMAMNDLQWGENYQIDLPNTVKLFKAEGLKNTKTLTMNLPSAYFETLDQFPEKTTADLLEGPWKTAATLRDYAAIFLFQSNKELHKIASDKIRQDPEKAVEEFCSLLSNIGTPKHFRCAAEFMFENRGKINQATFTKFYLLAQSKKAHDAADIIKKYADCYSEDEEKPYNEKYPIERYCFVNFSEPLLDRILKDAGIKESLLSNIRYKATGEKVPQYVVKCVVASYLGQYTEKPKHISGYKTDYIKFRLMPEVDCISSEFETGSLISLVDSISGDPLRIDFPQRLLLLGRYGTGEQINRMTSAMKKWSDWYGFGANGRIAIIIARSAILLSDTREAMLYADKNKLFDQYAKMRETDSQSLRDNVLSDFGLSEEGTKDYDLGNKKVTVRLSKDLSFEVLVPHEQKTMKSIPKTGADLGLYEKANADFSEMKKNLQRVVKGRNDYLFDSFLSGHSQSVSSWLNSYTINPVLKSVAKLVVWSQGKNTFILSDNGMVDSEGNPFFLDRKLPICVAHPMEMKSEEVKNWQLYFTSHQLKQPFLQIWEPVIDPANIHENRYSGSKQSVYRFSNKDKHGIHSFGLKAYSENFGFTLDECELDYSDVGRLGYDISADTMYTLGKFRFRRYTRRVNHIVSLLDKWTVEDRVKKDDITVTDHLNSFTLAQIQDLVDIANENNATKVLAVLLNWKNEHFSDFDPMKEFTLEL